MSTKAKDNQFDVILVGSGTSSATISRELAKQHKKVLILEQGSNVPLSDTISGIIAVAKEFVVGEKLKTTTAVTVGGGTSLYLGVCKLPSPEAFAELGIDLSRELEEVKKELPIAELSDDFLTPQSVRFRDSAKKLGYSIKKNLMFIDQSKCISKSYTYEAKWKAKAYLEEAIGAGATLITRAKVVKIIVENNRAIGVEYQHKTGIMGSKLSTAYGNKIILGAGPFSTPKLLMDTGIKNVGDRGFFCKPGFMVCGTIPELKGRDAFLGNLDIDLGNGVSLGDGTMNSSLFKLIMLSNFKLRQMFAHSKTISAGILLSDAMGGEISKEDGCYQKKLSAEEYKKLAEAEVIARKILENAGAKNIFRTNLVGGLPGGLLRVGEHLDNNLQTQVENLYVCDHSVILDVNSTSTLTLVCLGKYLARHLISSLASAK